MFASHHQQVSQFLTNNTRMLEHAAQRFAALQRNGLHFFRRRHLHHGERRRIMRINHLSARLHDSNCAEADCSDQEKRHCFYDSFGHWEIVGRL